MDMSRERWAGLALILATVTILGLIVIVLTTSASFRCTIVFDDAKGIDIGDRVVLRGIDIGVVDSVEFDRTGDRVIVGVKIDADHADKIRTKSTAFIDSISFPNVSGQMAVEIHNSADPSPPIEAGSVIEGKNSRLALLTYLGIGKAEKTAGDVREASGEVMERAKKAAGKVAEGAKNMARNAGQGIKNLTETDWASLLSRLASFMAEVGGKGKAAFGVMMEKWNVLRAETEAVREKLKEAGKAVLADQLRKLTDEIEKGLRERGDPAAEESPPAIEPTSSPIPPPIPA